MRYEEVEQTNEFVTLQFRAIDFECKTVIFKLYRNRSMGEKIEEYKSEKKKMNKNTGATFRPVDIAVKDIVRNDLERLIHVEVYMGKKRGKVKLIGTADFSIEGLKRDKKKTFSCFLEK